MMIGFAANVFFVLILVAIVTVGANATSGDDNRNWNLPSKTDNSDPDEFHTSLTFIPLSNHNNNDHHNGSSYYGDMVDDRLEKMLRYMIERDDEPVEKMVQRTRKEWEDEYVKSGKQGIKLCASIAAAFLRNDILKSFLRDTARQEELRQLALQIKHLLDSPLLDDPNQWHGIFGKLTSLEDMTQHQIISHILDHMEKKKDDNE